MQPTCACAAIEEMMKKKETCNGGDCTPLHMGLFFGIFIPCLFCLFNIIRIIRRKLLNRAPQVQTNIFVQPQPQVQMTQHLTHSGGPSVPSMPVSYALSSTMDSRADCRVSAGTHLPSSFATELSQSVKIEICISISNSYLL